MICRRESVGAIRGARPLTWQGRFCSNTGNCSNVNSTVLRSNAFRLVSRPAPNLPTGCSAWCARWLGPGTARKPATARRCSRAEPAAGLSLPPYLLPSPRPRRPGRLSSLRSGRSWAVRAAFTFCCNLNSIAAGGASAGSRSSASRSSSFLLAS